MCLHVISAQILSSFCTTTQTSCPWCKNVRMENSCDCSLCSSVHTPPALLSSFLSLDSLSFLEFPFGHWFGTLGHGFPSTAPGSRAMPCQFRPTVNLHRRALLSTVLRSKHNVFDSALIDLSSPAQPSLDQYSPVNCCSTGWKGFSFSDVDKLTSPCGCNTQLSFNTMIFDRCDSERERRMWIEQREVALGDYVSSQEHEDIEHSWQGRGRFLGLKTLISTVPYILYFLNRVWQRRAGQFVGLSHFQEWWFILRSDSTVSRLRFLAGGQTDRQRTEVRTYFLT